MLRRSIVSKHFILFVWVVVAASQFSLVAADSVLRKVEKENSSKKEGEEGQISPHYQTTNEEEAALKAQGSGSIDGLTAKEEAEGELVEDYLQLNHMKEEKRARVSS